MLLYWSITKKNYQYIFGNIIEWYDFSLYGYFALILSQQYFPFYPQSQAIIITFVTFAVGFFARPLGGALFGRLGDRYSHHYALKLSIQCIIWPTVLMGLLPNYDTWGISATIGLIVLRLLQGIAAGGQYGGCLTLLMEQNPGVRAQACSLAHISALLGYLCAIIISEIFFYLLPDSWQSNIAWRIPFILSLIFWWLQKKLLLEKATSSQSNVQFPLHHLFKYYRAPLLQSTLLSAAGGLFYYAIFVYSTTFVQQQGYSLNQSLLMNAAGLIISCLTLPYFAKLADHYGRKPILYASCWCIILLSPFLIYLLASTFWVLTTLALILLILCNTLFIAAVAVVYSELFPSEVRYSGCALSFNIGVILLGAITPALLSFFIPKTSLLFYGLYLSAGAILGLITTYFIKETKNTIDTKDNIIAL